MKNTHWMRLKTTPLEITRTPKAVDSLRTSRERSKLCMRPHGEGSHVVENRLTNDAYPFKVTCINFLWSTSKLDMFEDMGPQPTTARFHKSKRVQAPKPSDDALWTSPIHPGFRSVCTW